MLVLELTSFISEPFKKEMMYFLLNAVGKLHKFKFLRYSTFFGYVSHWGHNRIQLVRVKHIDVDLDEFD